MKRKYISGVEAKTAKIDDTLESSLFWPREKEISMHCVYNQVWGLYFRISIYILAAQWAPTLPSIEILTYLRMRRPKLDQRFTICWGMVPPYNPVCHFPKSGRTTTGTYIWPSVTAMRQGRRYYRKVIIFVPLWKCSPSYNPVLPKISRSSNILY